ncbi:MAG: HAD family phosphatase [Thiothrix sp.]|nr:HAD family phosphatase [Thiothrix sp.]HPE59635.1 HAD family phosphatase [Thiolinea sp.]
MESFAAFLFDMDGLLIDSERLALESFLESCTAFGLPEQHALFRRCIGVNAPATRCILHAALAHRIDFDAFMSDWNTRHHRIQGAGPIPLKPGVTELLPRLQQLERPMAVVTSSVTAVAQKRLQSVGILDYFRLVVGGDQVEHGKPAPDSYLRAATLLAVPASACLALEDSENGVRAALGAGMTVVQIPDLVEPDQEFRRLGHVVLPCLTKVMQHDFDFAVSVPLSHRSGG